MATTHEFTVTGTGLFPTDMLRYDACYPRTSEDAVALATSLDLRARPYRRPPRYVRLVSQVKPPTPGRWESFGWTVSDVIKRTVR